MKPRNIPQILVSAIVVCLSGSTFASDWNGSTSANWNDNANWSGGGGTNGSNAVINVSSPNIATISGNLPGSPVDIIIGTGGGTNGTLNQTAGDAYTGSGNWMFVGIGGGTGTYNLADVTTAGGGATGFGQGTGNMYVGGRLYIGGVGWGTPGGNGTVNVNTTGTYAMGNDLAVGVGSGTGVMNVDAGTITTAGWNFVGKNENGNTANGILTMKGGTLSNTGRTYIGEAGCTGLMTLAGGSYKNVNNEVIDIGDGGGGNGTVTINNSASLLQANGELWVGENWGNGVINLSAGTIASGNWVAVGRDNATGTVNMTGGTWTKANGGSSFIIGASGPGTLDQSGGLVDVQGGDTWMGESSTANFNLSGTGEFRASYFQIARNGSAVGNVNLNGGTLRANQIVGGGGAAHVHFNGTQVIATGSQTNFIDTITAGQAFIDAGGLKIDSNGYAITSPQAFNGSGGVTKSGNGLLNLSGTSSYTGANFVNAGALTVATRSGSSPNSGDYTVADGAILGIKQLAAAQSLSMANATFGSSGATTLDVDLGNIAGNPTAAPLSVTGTLTLNGTVTINVADQLPAAGTIPLVSYTGPKAGTGTFVLGTMPLGVVASFTDDGNGSVFLTVTSVSLPRWKGTTDGLTPDGVWDTATTENWTDLVSNSATSFSSGAPVLFNDDVSVLTSTVTLAGSVAPSEVTFNTSSLGYFLTGAGKITGTATLLKQGTASLSLLTVNNDYTGATVLEGGTTTVNKLASGGSPSSIGASSASPSNLILSGATLNYTGPAVSIDRGFTIGGANAVISNTNDLTLSGAVVTPIFGNLTKTGAGNLTLSHPGANVLGNTGYPALRVSNGTLTLDGSDTQTNSVSGELWIGETPDVPANLVLNHTTLTTNNWIALGRGNGSTGVVSSITATNSTIQCANFSSGYDAGLAFNDCDQNITLTNTNWTNAGVTYLAESNNAITTLTVGGTSVYVGAAQFLIAEGAGSTANVTIQDTASVTKTGGWLSIGVYGTGSMTVKNHATFASLASDFNVGDVGTSQGTLNISDAALVSSTGMTFVGKNGGTRGTINQTGGTYNGNDWISIGRYSGATGVVNVSGGSLNQITANRALLVGEEGTGTLTISGTGEVNVDGVALYLTNNVTGVGTINLDGGTLTTKQVIPGPGGTGNATFIFNGGLLKAGAGANTNFMASLGNASIHSAGAFIDTNSNNIALNQILSDDASNGTLTKSGAGTLYLNGVNTYTGITQVNAGSLGGTGTIPGALVIGANADLNPGVTTGVLSAGSVAFTGPSSTLTIEAAGSGNQLAVTNQLDLSNATLVLNGTPTLPVYVIASYGSLTGTFVAATLPPGYSIDYNYNGNRQIALVRLLSSYEVWIGSFFPGVTDPAIIGATADPDGDGQSNLLEFALGGSPNSSSNNAKIFSLIGDSNADGLKELLMTIAVRSGTPAFTGSPSPSASHDGATYTIEGSNTLDSFTATVTPVATVVPPSPNETAPTGYEYRTFSLDGSNGLPSSGFLRVKVTP